MANTVVLNLSGFRALRTLEPVQDFVHNLAEELAQKTGGDVELFKDVPRNRARSVVVGTGRDADAMMLALGEMTGLSIYTTKAGRRRLASEKQIVVWTRGSRP